MNSNDMPHIRDTRVSKLMDFATMAAVKCFTFQNVQNWNRQSLKTKHNTQTSISLYIHIDVAVVN